MKDDKKDVKELFEMELDSTENNELEIDVDEIELEDNNEEEIELEDDGMEMELDADDLESLVEENVENKERQKRKEDSRKRGPKGPRKDKEDKVEKKSSPKNKDLKSPSVLQRELKKGNIAAPQGRIEKIDDGKYKMLLSKGIMVKDDVKGDYEEVGTVDKMEEGKWILTSIAAEKYGDKFKHEKEDGTFIEHDFIRVELHKPGRPKDVSEIYSVKTAFDKLKLKETRAKEKEEKEAKKREKEALEKENENENNENNDTNLEEVNEETA